jgi:hypothetical protein
LPVEYRRLLINTVSTADSFLVVMNAWHRFNSLPGLGERETAGDAQA